LPARDPVADGVELRQVGVAKVGTTEEARACNTAVASSHLLTVGDGTEIDAHCAALRDGLQLWRAADGCGGRGGCRTDQAPVAAAEKSVTARRNEDIPVSTGRSRMGCVVAGYGWAVPEKRRTVFIAEREE
jgi:hypothetical protein